MTPGVNHDRTGALPAAQGLALCVCGFAVSLYAAAAAAFNVVSLTGGGLASLSLLTTGLWALFSAMVVALAWRALRPGALHGGAGEAAAPVSETPWRAALGLGLLMVFAAAWSALSLKPDLDDSYYVPNVTFAAAFPDAPITDEVRGVDAFPLEPFRSSHWAISVAYDYLSGSLGRLTGLHPLDVRYFWLPGLAGAMLAAGVFLLMLRIAKTEGEALLGAVAVVALYLIWRDAARDPGNFALPRLFQGKAVIMTALAPVFAAWLWGFLRRPTAIAATGLAGLALGAGGITASAVILYGAIGVGVFAAVLAERPKAAAATLRNALIAALCCAPLALPVWDVLTDPLPLGADSPANEDWPVTVLGHAGLLGKSTWLALVVSLGIVAVLARGAARRAVLAWAATVMVLFVNPLSGQALIDTIVGPNAYWRLFYALPWVPLIGLSAIAVWARMPAALATRRGLVLPAALALAATGSVALDLSRGETSFVWPPVWKLDRAARSEAEAVIAASPEGPMLAPLILSRHIPILDPSRPQLRMRTDGLRVWALHAGLPDMADRRILAVTALGGGATPGQEDEAGSYLGDASRAGAEAQLAALESVLAESAPASVVLRRDAALSTPVAARLEAAGYSLGGETAAYDIWMRESARPASGR